MVCFFGRLLTLATPGSAWYNRLALVLMTHTEKTQETLEMAMDVVVNGLHDSLTHLSTPEV